ncbi:rhomboid family intramembrane serine protease [Flavobacterium alkalisoli]|uniref:Rhomboid family intramembrane serine protease n=1 Tax=Flavobacterium alkalisoli TaxID=2602769 RepID=A0A5B9FPM7_9FLAO|nr:rhomboid family intramembrane serine protease [Flavobacterium alkalisoli]QEE48091.1 rhomboid family intramembrane serine protease [Flavobacterium alkalisoli]
MMRITETVKQLIIINILFFIGTIVVPQAYSFLALHFPLNPEFKLWQPVTHMFMHGNVPHILFNMLGLWMFGSALEHFWGTSKFLFFYLSCGIGAALVNIGIDYALFNNALQVLIENGYSKADILSVLNEGKILVAWKDVLSPIQLQNLVSSYMTSGVGASGALYGIMIAFAFMFPNAELMLIFFPIPIKAKYFVPGLLAFDLFMGVKGNAVIGQGDGVAHFAHLGGALVGFLIMWYWKKNQFNKNRWN